MPKSTTRRVRGHSETVPLLNKQDRIVDLLTIQVETFPQKALSSEEIERWKEDLNAFPLAAIEWAFENWRKNGQFFPVPTDILDQCRAWVPAAGTSLCDAACKSRHGKGYNEIDIKYFLSRYMAKKAAMPNRALTDAEVGELLDDLDKKRGHVPDWRKTA